MGHRVLGWDEKRQNTGRMSERVTDLDNMARMNTVGQVLHYVNWHIYCFEGVS